MNSVLSLLLACAFLSVAVSQGPVVTKKVTVYWTGGNPQCSNCGAPGQYACSSPVIGNWNNGIQTFQDPNTDPSYTLVNVTATLAGSYSCIENFNTLVQVTLQGQIVDILFLAGSEYCACSSCDAPGIFKNTLYQGGWPNFNNFGYNSVQVTITNPNAICLNRIDLVLTYAQLNTPRYAYLDVLFSGDNKNNCTVCGAPNAYSCTNYGQTNGILGTFRDPLPSGTIATTISARVYGSFRFGDSHTMSVALQKANIASQTFTGHGTTDCYTCDGGYDFLSTTLYQTGWPGYVYGGTNTIKVTLNYDHPICVGIIQLAIQYYPRDSEFVKVIN